MRICVNASPAVHHIAGLGRYTQELMAALLAIDSENEYIAFYNRPSEAQVDPPLDQLSHLTTDLGTKPWLFDSGECLAWFLPHMRGCYSGCEL